MITWRENLDVWNSSQFDISSEFDIFYSASGLRLVCDSLWTRAWMCEVFIGWQEHSERLWTNHSIAGNMFRILETSLDMTTNTTTTRLSTHQTDNHWCTTWLQLAQAKMMQSVKKYLTKLIGSTNYGDYQIKKLWFFEIYSKTWIFIPVFQSYLISSRYQGMI